MKEILEFAEVTMKIISERENSIQFETQKENQKKNRKNNKKNEKKQKLENILEISKKQILNFQKTFHFCLFLIRSEIRLFCYNPIAFNNTSLCSSFCFFLVYL